MRLRYADPTHQEYSEERKVSRTLRLHGQNPIFCYDQVVTREDTRLARLDALRHAKMGCHVDGQSGD
jgi:hypothetical protein